MNFYPKAFEAVKTYIMKAVGYLYNKVDMYQIIFIISVFDQGGFRKWLFLKLENWWYSIILDELNVCLKGIANLLRLLEKQNTS